MRQLAKRSEQTDKEEDEKAAKEVQEAAVAAEQAVNEAEEGLGEALVAEVQAEEAEREEVPAPPPTPPPVASVAMSFGSDLERRLRTKERWRHQQQLLQLQRLHRAARGSDVGKLPPLVPGSAVNVVLCVSPEQRARASPKPWPRTTTQQHAQP